MECDYFFRTRMNCAALECFRAQQIHHFGQVHFHGTSGNTRLAGKAKPDGVAAQYFFIGSIPLCLQ
jgi:hypothetical protein